MGMVDLTQILPTAWTGGSIARDVGTLQPFQFGSLTRVSRAGASLYYDEEIPVRIGFIPRAVRIETGYESFREFRWFRLEIREQAPVEDTLRLRKADTVVVGLRPLSLQSVYFAQVRHGHHKGYIKLEVDPDADQTMVQNAIDQLAYDYWESKSRNLVAGLLFPTMPDSRKRYQFTDKFHYTFGVCDDFDACRDALLQSEQAQQLLRLTEQNKLEFASPAVKKSLGSAPQLYQEIIEERYALLLEAAHHALAGRHRNAAPITIYDELSYNYRDLLNYENRRLHNAKKRASALYKDHQHTQEADREHDQYFGIDDTTNSLFKEDEN